jgi:cell fate regulator YaaT (PSP1 superfamily)
VAEERLRALVRRLGASPDIHVAVWGGIVGRTGQNWVEDDGRGIWLVKVLRSPLQDEEGEPVGTLLRQAGPGDLERHRKREEELPALLKRARERARARDLPMKFIAGELDLERRLLRLFFTAPSRVDFRKLLRELGGEWGLRVELRQVGPRDVARLLGGIGPCGRPLCCRTFLRQLRPVPLELAFDQQLFFSPERITGYCGRLMCCLAYEHSQYVEALSGLPKVGQKITLDGRRAKITGVNIFHETVYLTWEDGKREELTWEAFNSARGRAAPEAGSSG